MGWDVQLLRKRAARMWQAHSVQNEFDQYTRYRQLYHLDKFLAGWRTLVAFYLAMFIPGYALNSHSCAFWGAWAALLMILWEPYLSPPFPWTDDSVQEDDLAGLEPRGRRLGYMAHADAEEEQAVRQWLYAVRRAVPRHQQAVYRFMALAIWLPFVVLAYGVFFQQYNKPAGQSGDITLTYSSFLLLGLMMGYVGLTTASAGLYWTHIAWQLRGAGPDGRGYPHWSPKDMLYFICKILGETLNMVVGALVAGSFAVYMTPLVFWLCVAITGMSYTATNLLYDLGPGEPVRDWRPHEHGCDCLLPLRALLAPPGRRRQRVCGASAAAGGGGKEEAVLKAACWDDAVAEGPEQAGTDEVSPQDQQHAAGAGLGPWNVAGSSGGDAVAVAMGGGGPAAEGPPTVVTGAWEGEQQQQEQEGEEDNPPFLLYKRPKGARGNTITLLLIGLVGPCVVLMTLLVKGLQHILLPGSQDQGCTDICQKRYVQLLWALSCLGLITAYYAANVRFMGAGPVTFVYRLLPDSLKSHSRKR